MGKGKGKNGGGGGGDDWGSKSVTTKLEEKLLKAAGEALVDTMRGMDEQELRDRLVSLAQHEKETDDKLEADEKIKELKEELKNLQGPFKDTLKSIKLQRSYAALRLEEMGKG
jgi:hypothetical protein